MRGQIAQVQLPRNLALRRPLRNLGGGGCLLDGGVAQQAGWLRLQETARRFYAACCPVQGARREPASLQQS